MSTETASIQSSANVACGTRNLIKATNAARKPAQASHFGRNPVLSAATEVRPGLRVVVSLRDL
jgi:hypothetical protein